MIKLQYLKLPGNSYSYKSSIFGIPIRDALILSMIASASILAVRISLYSPTLGAAAILLFLFFRRRPISRIGEVLKLNPKGRKINIFFPVSIRRYNEHLFTIIGKNISIFIEIRGLNIMAIRVHDQKTILEGLRNALEVPGMDIDFFSCHQRGNGVKNGLYSFRTYVRITAGIFDSGLERSFGELVSLTSNFQSTIKTSGFSSRELNEPQEIEDLLKILMQ